MALHPRYQTYGLTEADALLVNSFRQAARAAGWSGQQIDQAFEWYRAQGDRLDRMSSDDMLASFQEFTAHRGWSDNDVSVALGWFDAAGAALERGEAPPLETPTAEEDRLRRGELEELMRRNPQAYWGDTLAQDDLHEIYERAAGQPPLPQKPMPPLGRRVEIEQMMKSDPAQYWGSSEIQAEYRTLLGGAVEPAGVASPSAAPAGVDGAPGGA